MQQIDKYDEPVNRVLYNKHRRRKNHDLVAAMYAMYCVPRSLEQVGNVYHKSRQAVYDLFKSRGYELRHKEYKGLQVLDGINFTLTEDGYLRGTLNKKRITMHRYIWEKNFGPIPEGHGIKFKDEDRTNNSLDNLELIKIPNRLHVLK